MGVGKGATLKWTDIVKQIVYRGVIDLAELKFGLLLGLNILPQCDFGAFHHKVRKIPKTWWVKLLFYYTPVKAFGMTQREDMAGYSPLTKLSA